MFVEIRGQRRDVVDAVLELPATAVDHYRHRKRSLARRQAKFAELRRRLAVGNDLAARRLRQFLNL